MRIYTRTGDDGTTGLLGGPRTTKADWRVEAYGTLDEANAMLGAARALAPDPSIDAPLACLQDDLFRLGAEVATAPGCGAKLRVPPIGDLDIERIEATIDTLESELPALRAFIIPGGSQLASHLHLARCVVRRAERVLVRAHEEHPLRAQVLRYANRVSDLLFVLARKANQLAGVGDQRWESPG